MSYKDHLRMLVGVAFVGTSVVLAGCGDDPQRVTRTTTTEQTTTAVPQPLNRSTTTTTTTTQKTIE
jgi:hypothetical protein